jgi:hypothetical protein
MSRILLFFGHGRALETYLVCVKLLFAVFVLEPLGGGSITVVSDLHQAVPDSVIALPFFIVGVVQGVGIWLNYEGVSSSWVFRAAGAFFAMMLWNWIIVKAILIGVVVTGMMPFVIMSLVASTFILWKALNRLPVPGAVGL